MDLLFCISCFLPKKVQLKFVQNFETLKKKGVKTLNTFGPLCLWQCFIWDGCFYWNWLSKYISCWNFLLYFIWQSETRKICPLDLHFVENLNGKSPVRASPLSSVSLIWNSGEFFQKCKRFQTFKAVTCIVLGGSSFNKRSFTFFDPIILQARAHCAWNWINFLLLSEIQLLALFFYNRSFATTGRYCNCQIG